jgi:hypothetical protein
MPPLLSSPRSGPKPMLAPIRKLATRRLQATLCLLAVAMQVSVPALHAPHAAAVRPEVAAAHGAPALVAAGDHAEHESRHDQASCPQCRLVSQLKSFAPLVVVANSPALEAGWLATVPAFVVSSHGGRDGSAPRAPPFLA